MSGKSGKIAVTRSDYYDSFINSLPVLADTLGKSYGVDVKIVPGKATASTDGKVIIIPQMDQSPEAVIMLRGYLDHEAGHIRHTRMACMSSLGFISRNILNIMEDWRIEKKMSEEYPGCRRNFRELIELVFLRKLEEDPLYILNLTGPDVPDLNKYLTWLNLYFREMTVPALGCYRVRLADALPGWMTELTEKYLKEVFFPSFKTSDSFSDSTKGCVKRTVELYEMLKKGFMDNPPEDPRISPEGGPETNSPDCSDSIDSTQGNPEDTEEALEGPEKGDKAPGGSEASSGAPEAPEAGGDSSFRAASEAAWNNFKHGYRQSYDKTDIIRELSPLWEKNSLVEKDSDGVVLKPLESFIISGEKKFGPVAPERLTAMRMFGNKLKARFHAVLQTRMKEDSRIGLSGRLDCRRLARIKTGDSRVFSRRTEGLKLNTAIHILLDMSGSMRGSEELMENSSYALASALHGINGINLGISVFPHGRTNLAAVIKHGEKLHSNFSMSSRGGTPMGQALSGVGVELVRQKEERKICLIITDGCADDLVLLDRAVTQVKRQGVELYGIGINTDSLASFLPAPAFICVDSVEELLDGMFSMIEKVIL